MNIKIYGFLLFSLLAVILVPAYCNASDGPDLIVSAIQIYPYHPSRPKAGQPFTLQVYVSNIGTADSGQYDIALFIRDISRGATYPIGTFRKNPMRPGENYPVYSSNNRIVNDPGFFQVQVEIKPFLFEDARPENNTASYNFVVD